MSWDWEKLKQQQQGRGPTMRANLKGTDESGFATELGEVIITCVWNGIRLMLMLCGVAVVGFAFGFGFTAGERFLRGILL